ncbi:hypothetical protein RRG48_03800 [Mycoplasmopsis canis]|uniref:MAG3090 family protein n=1 Tax=Mycoplasmopsis cynos TaxID=171284 RepID=UPI002AFE12A1|nr:hypothetical protein [Mycoplasmopsis cynos]WQQ13195.1 hypothetical protein RRG58_00385 [Mycoplasmopsis cynos]WQQ13914.1 hypothetical protein RRG52_04135 [Mycoplasmopsis cynos]
MKRLNCLYKPSFDKNFPWVLKHPKVKAALAVFKTRKAALNWFYSLDYECAIWFQTVKKIVGGLIINEKNSDSIYEYDLDVERFEDGKVNYSDAMDEIFVSTTTGLRNDKAAIKFLETIHEKVDYKVISDHKTYFPIDDDYIPERRKNSKDIQIEKLTQEVNELDELLKDTSGKFKQEIEELKLKLKDSNADKEALLKEIKALRMKIVEESVVQAKEAEKVVKETKKAEPKKVVEKVEIVKEVVKEVPIYIEKEVIKEVPVYIEKEVVKEVQTVKQSVVESKKYAYIKNLSLMKQLESLALYAKKVEAISNSYEKEVITSEKDFMDIKSEFEKVLGFEKTLASSNLDDKSKQLLKLISKSLATSVEKLSKVIKGSKEVEYVPAKFIYYKKSTGENLRLAQILSYVSYDGKHIAFVNEKDYKYAIFTSPTMDKSYFLVFESATSPMPIASPAKPKSEVAKPAEVTEASKHNEVSWAYTFWAIILYGIAYVILLVLVIVLAIAYFGGN